MTTTPRHIELMDTTLRDGEQTQGVSFTPDEKVNIAQALLKKLNVDRIEVASAKVSSGEMDAVSTINGWAADQGFLHRVEVLGFVDFNRSVDWIRQTGGQVLNLLTKGSEKHCRMQLNKTQEQHIADIYKTLDYAQEHGLKVNMYLEDWSNGYKDNRDYVYRHMEAMQGRGISHFLLPDTLGIMGPDEVHASISDMVTRYPGNLFDFHPHNDYGLATANVMAAVKAGAAAVHCTINCLGERAGNASLAEVTVVLKDKLGMQLSINEHHIFDVSKLVENFSGKWIAANMPVVGTDVFTQTAGIHADGDKKGGLYESTLTPERFQRTRTYALGKMSGKASLLKNLEALDMTLSEENQQKVLKRIVELGDSKQMITPEDIPFIIADVLESKDYNHVLLEGCSISSDLSKESTVRVVATVFGNRHEATGTGNGGFDAFMNAINQVLEHYDYKLPKLEDYEVRIPRGGETSALTESIITWQSSTKRLKTRGVHANQVYAAINAALRLINLQLQERVDGPLG
jgi:(R)-citramalate synthase